MSSPEMYLLYNQNARKASYTYWLGSPYSFEKNVAQIRYVAADGSFNNSIVGSYRGMRPAVSLISGLEYSRGDGSMTNPYVVSLDT